MSELEPVRARGHAPRLGVSDLPGLARVAVVSSLRIGVWATANGVRAGVRVIDVARHPSHAGEFAEDVQAAAHAITRALVGTDVEARMRQVATGNPVVRVVSGAMESVNQPGGASETSEPANPLHQAGQRLLRESRDVWNEAEGHPAYTRMIEELAPDEARILMLLLRKGPQASVNVRTGGMVGTVSSSIVASNLTMIGALAGCRRISRVPSYLHNLQRLGLIWFSRETLRDPSDYQVLEAQPDVLEATGQVRRAKIVRRSIHLTPFGEDFCREGLGLHLAMDELKDIPQHGKPGAE